MTLLGQSESCRCIEKHPSAQFCDSDFSALVKVNEKRLTQVQNNITYLVDVQRIYRARNDKGTEVLKDGRLTTWKSTAACGVQLHIGKTYIVTGTLNTRQNAPPQASIHQCKYYVDINHVDQDVKLGFEGEYAKHCKH